MHQQVHSMYQSAGEIAYYINIKPMIRLKIVNQNIYPLGVTHLR